jgi:acetyltransferase-like isoleucine patch superfamily enzyme
MSADSVSRAAEEKFRNEPRPKSLVGKALWVLRHRPVIFLGALRGYALFRLTRLLQPLFWHEDSGVRLGVNVRVQRLRCLNADRPNGRITIGDHSVVYEKAELGAYGGSGIEIGECAVLGDIRISSRYGIRIGRRFLSSWNVYISDFDPHPADPSQRGRQVQAMCGGFRPRYAPSPYPDHFKWEFAGEPITIGDDVWLGANCTILKGARIGSGSIVAASAVVLAGDYPERSLIAGNPARVVKSFQGDTTS